MNVLAESTTWGISSIIHALSQITEIYGHVTGLPRNELGIKEIHLVRMRPETQQNLPSKWR